MNSKHFGKTCLISAAMILGGLCDVPVIAQQKQPTAIEQVAKALESALKSFTGRQQKLARPAVPAPVVEFREMAPPAVARADVDINKRLRRLEAHGAVLRDWVNLYVDLSEEQQQQLEAKLSTAIANSQAAWKAENGRNTAAMDDFFAINFTDTTGPARNLYVAATDFVARANILSGQSGKLSRDAVEREEFYRDAALGYVLNLLDEVFFLTPDQRMQMSEIVSKHVDLNGPCYSMQSPAQARRYVQYFKTTPVFGPMLSINDVFSPNQKLLVGDLTAGQNGNNYLTIRTGDDSETFQETLRTSAKTQLQSLNRQLAVRIDFYQSTSKLTDKQVRHLQLAGKGAMDDVLRAWKTNTTKTMERYKTQQQFAGRNVSIGISFASLRQLMDNSLWKQTLESMVDEDSKAVRDRDKIRQDARVKFAVALLDRELWLDPFQRQRLLKSVGKALPAVDDTISQQQNVDEISLLCIPLFKLSKLDLTILSPAQRTVWKELKELFTLNGSYARVQTKRHGTLSIRLPN